MLNRIHFHGSTPPKRVGPELLRIGITRWPPVLNLSPAHPVVLTEPVCVFFGRILRGSLQRHGIPETYHPRSLGGDPQKGKSDQAGNQ